jgi:hypothetical protein
MLYVVTARHSPCRMKRLVVESRDVDDALEQFFAANLAHVQTLQSPVARAELTAALGRWKALDGLVTVDVQEAAPGAVADVPTLPRPAPRSATPPHRGQVGRRPAMPTLSTAESRKAARGK